MVLGVGSYIVGAGVSLPGLLIADMKDVFAFIFKLIPVCMVVSAMQLLLYELTDNLLNAVVLQFVVTISLGYISGCFYPSYFFPESVQKLSALLPVGASMNYLSDFFLAKAGVIFIPLLWCIVLVGALCIARTLNMKGGRD